MAQPSRSHRRSRLLSRPGDGNAGEACDRRQANDANRSRRSLRACGSRPRLEQHHAAKKKSCVVRLHSRHDLVQALCAKAIEQRRPLFDILAETPEVTRHVDAEALRKLCDPARYLGLSAAM